MNERGDRFRHLFSLPKHNTPVQYPISDCCGGPMSDGKKDQIVPVPAISNQTTFK